jgi:hypothetical protein
VTVYKLLADHYLPEGYGVAGQTYTPTNPSWRPTVFCDPLDAGATAMFYAQGPVPTMNGLLWNGLQVKGTTYWIQVGPTQYALTGLGSNRGTYSPINTP